MDIAPAYLDRIVSDVKLARPLKIAVDCGNGVAGAFAPELYTRMGCTVVPLYCDVDGTFPNHHPDPSQPANLRDLIARLGQGDCDLGLAFDGDGDRLGVVTREGHVIYADRQLMLFAADLLERQPGATVIYDVKSTRNLKPWIVQHGGVPLLWKTGHSLIKGKMKEIHAALAGEMSGHTFFGERWYGFDDGLYAGARLLEILSRHANPSAVLDGLPDALSTPELNVQCAEGEAHALIDRMAATETFPGSSEVIRVDGLRVEYADGFGLARASNTTPVIVLRFEADNAARPRAHPERFPRRPRPRQARRRAPLLTMADAITLADIEAARARIAGGIYVSPCVESIPLSQLTGAHVFCKLDYLQRTGSFKERGARNALLLLNDEQRKRGVIAASAGNHAQGIAYHGSLLGIPVTVVMPKFAALIKVTNCRHLGANVVLHGADLGEARARAEEIARGQGLTFIHPFDNANVMAGQGTMALEILEQTPDVEAIVVPVGGGGLLAGIGTVFKALRPQARVVGVEPEHAACLTAARAAGHPVPVTLSPTLADGLAVPLLGKLPFAVLERVVDQVVTVDEAHIALAILRLIELEKSVVEGGGAAPLAAFLSGKLDNLKGKRVVLTLCGGNIDLTMLGRVMEVGLVADGRLSRFTVSISDRPGGLARLAELIASTGASIQEILHDRAFSGPDLTAVRVVCVVETTGHAHVRELHAALAAAGMQVTDQ